MQLDVPRGTPTVDPGNAFTSGHFMQTLAANAAEATAPLPAPESILGYLSPSRALHNFGAGAVETLQGIHHIFDSNGPDPTTGMTPEQRLQYHADAVANQGQRQVAQFAQDPLGAYARAAGQQAPGAIVGGAGIAALQKILSPAAMVRNQNYTPSHAAAFEGLTGKANGMGKNFIPQQLTPDVLSPIRQSASDMLAGSPTERATTQTAIGGAAPLDRLGAVQNIIQRSLSDLEAKHGPALQQAAQNPISMGSIQQGLRSQIIPGMSTADIAGINDLIDRAGQITNLGDLNKFRQIMNTEASPTYRQSPTQAGRASAPQAIASGTADAVRQYYFDQLQQATGTDFAPLKRQESSLLTVKEALENMTSPAAKAEAQFNAPSTPRAKLGEAADAVVNVVKNPKKLIQQQILRESPASDISNLIRKSLTDLPEPTQQTPQGIAPQASNAPQLPANATPTTLQGTPVNPPIPLASLPPEIQRILALTRGNQ